MIKAIVAFDFDDDYSPEQIGKGHAHLKYMGFQEISCLMTLDVKMDLTRKTCFDAGRHLTHAPVWGPYSSV
jgi:hypothetical protein